MAIKYSSKVSNNGDKSKKIKKYEKKLALSKKLMYTLICCEEYDTSYKIRAASSFGRAPDS